MTQRVYIVRGASPYNSGWDVDPDGHIFGVYATRELAEVGLEEAMQECGLNPDEFDDEEDYDYALKELAPWIDERAVQGSASSANRKPVKKRTASRRRR